MNQKVIPISLRLHKNKNWNSKWIVEKNDYSKIINLDLNIKKYFYTIFNYKKMTWQNLVVSSSTSRRFPSPSRRFSLLIKRVSHPFPHLTVFFSSAHS